MILREQELHRRLTVISGLDEAGRARLVMELIGEAMAEFGSDTSIDILLRTGDLPDEPRRQVEAEPVTDADDVARIAAEEQTIKADLEAARAALDPEARDAHAAAEAAVAEAKGAFESTEARRLSAEEAVRTDAEAHARRTARTEAYTSLQAGRAATAGELAEAQRLAGDAVAEALAAYRRLQSVKRRPSARAAALADRWSAYRARQHGELPETEPPPEYLLAPAQAALEAARAAVEEAERAGEVEVEIDADAVEELERAHRRVLEAEQRTNLRPSRLNRRRLEASRQAERHALVRLSVADYDDYLQRIVPAVRKGKTTRTVEAARAALADAEAVWEELHGGVPPMSDEEIAVALEDIRREAAELLGADSTDDALEERLRAHLEQVVDVEWARDALDTALRDVGIEPGNAPEPAAEQWLKGSGERAAHVQELQKALAALDEELAAAPAPAPTDSGDETGHGGAEVTAELNAAFEAARQEAEAAQANVDQARAARNEAAKRVERGAEAEHRVAQLSARLAEIGAARRATEDAAAAGDRERAAAALGSPSVELTLYSLARLAALRAVPDVGPAPFIVDDAFTGLDPVPRASLLDLLYQASATTQVVYITSSDDIVSWAENLPADDRLVRR